MNATATTASKKTVAVWKLASCDGCQLTLLNMEDELLSLAETINIAYFLEASSNPQPGPFDLSLVEGSITTEHDRKQIQQIRQQSTTLITIGACACTGGIQALRNHRQFDHMLKSIYAHPEYLDTLDTSTAVADHVPVDYELRGCPINKAQLLEVITSYLHQKRPGIANESVCMACKRRGNPCILVSQGEPCLGPITHAGCDALCPTYGRGCYGCYGEKEQGNPEALMAQLSAMDEEVKKKHPNKTSSHPSLTHFVQQFNVNSKVFLRAAQQVPQASAHEKQRPHDEGKTNE